MAVRVTLLSDLNGLRYTVIKLRDQPLRSRDANMRVRHLILLIRIRNHVASDLLGQQLPLILALVETLDAKGLPVAVINPCSALRKPTISSIIGTTLWKTTPIPLRLKEIKLRLDAELRRDPGDFRSSLSAVFANVVVLSWACTKGGLDRVPLICSALLALLLLRRQAAATVRELCCQLLSFYHLSVKL